MSLSPMKGSKGKSHFSLRGHIDTGWCCVHTHSYKLIAFLKRDTDTHTCMYTHTEEIQCRINCFALIKALGNQLYT